MSEETKEKFFNINLGHIITICVYLLTIGFFYGTIRGDIDKHDFRINYLERERDRDNKQTYELIQLLQEIKTDLKWLKDQKEKSK